MQLTGPQRRALEFLSRISEATACQIGEAACGRFRQDSEEGRKAYRSSQASGRIGGGIANRLIRIGLVKPILLFKDSYYSITLAGRQWLRDNKER